MISNRQLAKKLGVSDSVLRRELLGVEAAGLVHFERIGLARIIEDSQIQAIRDWLERRGLLKSVEAATA
jgi:DNA-binding GntR family transcriptional regulator